MNRLIYYHDGTTCTSSTAITFILFFSCTKVLPICSLHSTSGEATMMLYWPSITSPRGLNNHDLYIWYDQYFKLTDCLPSKCALKCCISNQVCYCEFNFHLSKNCLTPFHKFEPFLLELQRGFSHDKVSLRFVKSSIIIRFVVIMYIIDINVI